MRFFEVLCEGGSDVPVLEEVLVRRFGLRKDLNFRIHAHAGKGKLPRDTLAIPGATRRGLLDQLPAKLRAYGKAEAPDYQFIVVVLVDADDEDCRRLKRNLVQMYESLPSKPSRVLFRIAVEETESWFVADRAAIKAAFPSARLQGLRKITPDSVCGAWEQLAQALGFDPSQCSGADKYAWSTRIAPYLELKSPSSPSLRALVDGLKAHVSADA